MENNSDSLVMGAVGSQSSVCKFSDKVPPRFDGHGDYAAYRDDVGLWVKLTSLPSDKQGPAIVGHLHGEAKIAAKTLDNARICADGGVDLILERLDKAYAVDNSNRLD